MNSLSDLVDRLKEVEADRLVDVLRRMHNEGARPDWSALSKPAEAAPASPVVEPRQSPAPQAASSRDNRDEARGFFVDLETKLRKQQSTADAVIGRLRARERRVERRAADPSPAQQLVSIVALANSRAAGRFVVVHPGTAPARIELRASGVRGEGGRSIGADVTLEPAAFELAARARRIVKITFDLRGADVRDGERLLASVEAIGASGRRLLQVSVEIDVFREDGDALQS